MPAQALDTLTVRGLLSLREAILLPRTLLCPACLSCFDAPSNRTADQLQASLVHVLVERCPSDLVMLDVEREARRLLAPLSSRPVTQP